MRRWTRWTILFGPLAVLSLAGGCTASRAVDARVDEQVKAEPEVPLGTPASNASRKVILEAKEITDGQRRELLNIHSRMAADVAQIRGEMAKLQVILFREVLDPDAEEREIRNIRRRLINLDRKRTNRILAAIDEAEQVIGQNYLQQDGPRTRPLLIESLDPWKMM